MWTLDILEGSNLDLDFLQKMNKRVYKGASGYFLYLFYETISKRSIYLVTMFCFFVFGIRGPCWVWELKALLYS